MLMAVFTIYYWTTDCWNPEPHQRPTFKDIIHHLEEIACSSFVTTPQDSFHTLQEDWKLEIDDMFEQLRCKEKVMRHSLECGWLDGCVERERGWWRERGVVLEAEREWERESSLYLVLLTQPIIDLMVSLLSAHLYCSPAYWGGAFSRAVVVLSDDVVSLEVAFHLYVPSVASTVVRVMFCKHPGLGSKPR